MNKSELIDAMAADAGISKASAKKALESFLGSVSSTLQGGGRVSLVGLDLGQFLKELQEMVEIHKLVQQLKSLLRKLLNLKLVLNYLAQLTKF